MSKRLPGGLYGMIDLPPYPPAQAARRGAALARALLRGGSRVLQVRMKEAPAASMLAVLGALKDLTREYPGTLLFVNDRVDVAMAGGADGVHLGQTDLALAQARRACPAGFLIGISTHDEEQAAAAVAGGADYVAVGPIYPTKTKQDPDPVVGVERLAALCRSLPAPVVAIGGIDLEHVAEVAAAGARAAAIISAVNGAPDVTAAARAVMSKFKSPE